jgi:hypothetical protein
LSRSNSNKSTAAGGGRTFSQTPKQQCRDPPSVTCARLHPPRIKVQPEARPTFRFGNRLSGFIRYQQSGKIRGEVCCEPAQLLRRAKATQRLQSRDRLWNRGMAACPSWHPNMLKEVQLEIAHILFVDTVGYSKQLRGRRSRRDRACLSRG